LVLSNQQFDRIRRLASALAGIELVDRHRELLRRRGRRLGIEDPAAMDALLDSAEQNDAPAVRRLVCLLTTKFTGFFRHPRHFELAATRAQLAIRRRGRARLWTAGAATGEEPYSLAMALIEGVGRSDPPVDILATDLDAEALAAAEQGEFTEFALRALQPAQRERFLAEGPARGRWVINPEPKKLVRFFEVNLARDDWPIAGPFDVIFCRNVLMYLEDRYRLAALERIARLLEPDGLLMLDPTEHLGRGGRWFKPGTDGVFALRSKSDAGETVATTNPTESL
jgi:chemotaxis protein methyltransferase CheR